MRPYSEIHPAKGLIIREFKHDVSSEDLEWHMDKNDRIITVLEGHGWMLQLETGLPFDLSSGESYKILKESWHRIIKGSDNLKILINEKDCQIKQGLK